MLLWREQVPSAWLANVLENIPALLVDHAHLERKAATSALTLEKYQRLYGKLEELNAIAIEELQHFQLVLDLLKRRRIPYGPAQHSHWISGLMGARRAGSQEQVIDHLICCALIEGRSCDKFQLLAKGLAGRDPELAQFYGSLVESEGNHYAAYLIMARNLDEEETTRRLDHFLDLEADLILQPNAHPTLH